MKLIQDAIKHDITVAKKITILLPNDIILSVAEKYTPKITESIAYPAQ